MGIEEAVSSLAKELNEIYKPGTFSVGRSVGLEPEVIYIYAHKRVAEVFKTYAKYDANTNEGEYLGYKIKWRFWVKLNLLSENNMSWTQRELEALEELAKKQDLTTEQVLRQALRVYQLVVNNRFQLVEVNPLSKMYTIDLNELFQE